MAKKKASKKKKVTKKPATAKALPSRSKKTAKKSKASKKPSTQKKPVAKKSAAKKKTAKKPAAKKTTKKSTAAKKTTKKTTKKPAAKKSPSKPSASSKKKPAKKSPSKKTTSKVSAPASTDSKPAAGKDAKATNRKGITIVKPSGKKSGGRSRNAPKFVMPERPQLLGPGSAFAKKPLIPSGPSAPKNTSVFDEPKSKRKKSPLTKTKLEKYRQLLIAKRSELLGDVTNMENEALRSGGSGGLSNTPQHAAEQGSENYDQTLSLNLAAQDRRLIKDIDDALARIEAGTYGLCELTAHPIPEARLNELPWARYTIEAAREIERRGGST